MADCPAPSTVYGKSVCGTLVETRLNQDIDHLAILIDAAPEILPLTLDSDEHLIQVQTVAQATLAPLEGPGLVGTELHPPLADCFAGNCEAALREEVLNVSKAETKAVVEPDGMADDFGRKSVSPVAGGVAVHPPSLADTATN